MRHVAMITLLATVAGVLLGLVHFGYAWIFADSLVVLAELYHEERSAVCLRGSYVLIPFVGISIVAGWASVVLLERISGLWGWVLLIPLFLCAAMDVAVLATLERSLIGLPTGMAVAVVICASAGFVGSALLRGHLAG
jgi:hypothetical protein